MTREEIAKELRATGRIDHYDRHNTLWKEAFKAYNQANKVNMSMKCNKCVAAVQQWIAG